MMRLLEKLIKMKATVLSHCYEHEETYNAGTKNKSPFQN